MVFLPNTTDRKRDLCRSFKDKRNYKETTAFRHIIRIGEFVTSRANKKAKESGKNCDKPT